MDNSESMSWKSFKETLMQNPDSYLQFQYAANKRVNTSYHITEIKQAPIVSVDCGGVMNRWTEIIVQLWEPGGLSQVRAMKVKKALSIIAVVEKMMPLDLAATVKIEFGSSKFDTRQMLPNQIFPEGENLVIDLRPDAVQCKANNRGGGCGEVQDETGCCTSVATQPIKDLTVAPCCEPSCCS